MTADAEKEYRMDNLITCEYCGTVYDPNDGPCPICQGHPEDIDNYMGDHFDYDEREVDAEPEERRPVGGRIAALIALVLLFLGFTGYLLYSFELLPFMTPAPAAPVQETIPCTALAVDATELILNEAGQTVQLHTAVEPADTTDRLIFSVDNSAVVSVNQSGSVVARAPGEANITVICGGYIAYCKAICDFGGSDPGNAEPEPEPEPQTGEPLKISAEDISFFEKGENTTLTLSGGDGSDPVWRSEDSSIATVDDGYVVAVGSGTVDVTATVGDETVTCIVRCQFE